MTFLVGIHSCGCVASLMLFFLTVPPLEASIFEKMQWFLVSNEVLLNCEAIAEAEFPKVCSFWKKYKRPFYFEIG